MAEAALNWVISLIHLAEGCPFWFPSASHRIYLWMKTIPFNSCQPDAELSCSILFAFQTITIQNASIVVGDIPAINSTIYIINKVNGLN